MSIIYNTDKFYDMMTNEEREFISSYNFNTSDLTSLNVINASDPENSEVVLIRTVKFKTTKYFNSSTTKYYRHNLNSIKTYIRDKKIEKILQ